MKGLELFRFEVGYQARRLWTWAYAAAMLAISFLIATRGMLESAQHRGYWFNAPFNVAQMTLIGSVMGLLVAAAFSGDAGARDPETRMAPLVYTSPIGERDYVGGRFFAAFLLNALVMVTVQAAMLTAVLVSDVPPELIGPMRIATYVSSYGLLALPNALLATTFLFSLSLLTRRSAASYLGAVVLFFISIIVWQVVGEKLGHWNAAKILDPLGITVIREVSLTTTAAQKNALSLWANSSLLINRAAWLTVAGIIFVVSQIRFRFEAGGARAPRRNSLATRASVVVRERSVPISVPKVERSTAAAVRTQQFIAIAAQSFREVAISWGGLVLLLLALITTVLGPKAMAHLGVPVIPTTEQMTSWIGHPGEVLWFIIPILTTFYAGELVWRDREVRLSEIADATPVPEWVQLTGKFAGLALMLAAYEVMLVVACILIQVQMGYHNFEPGLYLKAVLGLSLLEHLLFGALALALHVIIDQKYVGYLVVIGAYAFTASASSLGIENHLLVYGSSPDWSYSDISGFAPSIVPWMWLKSYWAAWAILLCTFAALMWVRGKEPGFKARVKLMGERLSLRTVAIAGAMGALIVVTGGFIFYNTNVVNPTISEAARFELRARYEKTYGRFASLGQPALTGLSLRVDLLPSEHRATVHARYALVNRSRSPIRNVHFLPDDDVETSAAEFDRPVRQLLDDKKLRYRIYELSTPLAPGDSLHVSFTLRSTQPAFATDETVPAVIANGTYFEGNDWLPDIGYSRARELRIASDRKAYGLAPRREFASLDDTAARNDPGARRIAFDAVVATDHGQTAVAPGELRRTWLEGGRRYFHYVADAPIRNDFAIYSARYAVRTEKWNAVQIQVMYHPDHADNVGRMIAGARASLDYFTKHLGPYPYRELRLVEHAGQDMSLHASPINISYQEAFAGLNPGADKRQFDLVYAVVAHETGHQWWGNQLSPADVEGGPLLTESLAWYSAMCIVAGSLGEDHLQRLLDMMHQSSWTISTRASVPLMQISTAYAAYRKGPFAMYALREYLGEDKVDSALRRLFDQYKSGEPPLPTSRDLYAELEAVTPDSLQGMLGDLFERNTFWELKTKSVAAEPAAAGKWRVTLDVNARKVVVDTHGGETEVPMNDLVEIGVYGNGGSAVRGVQLYRAFHRVKAGAQRISVLVDAKPVRAGIDPRYLLIDQDPSDNLKDLL